MISSGVVGVRLLERHDQQWRGGSEAAGKA